MVLISVKILKEYWEKHPQSKTPLQKWASEVKEADWKSFSDVKNHFASADYVGNGRVVFNIKGNDFRIVALMIYRVRTVFIRFVGSHSEYDKIKDIQNI
jgi:mRNA interferase HigB